MTQEGNFRPETEGFLFVLQERAIKINYEKYAIKNDIMDICRILSTQGSHTQCEVV